MGNVISVCLQKGGIGKTTFSCSIAYLLSEDHNKKTLLVDFDPQGNATYITTQKPPTVEFKSKTVKEAIMNGNVENYIVKLSDRLDLLPSNDYLADIHEYLYTQRVGKTPNSALRDTLEAIRSNYDYIIIDCPPALGDLTSNALTASDFALVTTETSKLAFIALTPMIGQIKKVQKYSNPDLKILGIAVNVVDKRRIKDNLKFFRGLNRWFPDMKFKTDIARNAEASRLADYGMFKSKKVRKAVKEYEKAVKEMIERVELQNNG